MKLSEVALATESPVAAVPPTMTPVAPVKLVPVSVMVAPPAVLVVEGELPVTVGGASYVKAFEEVVVPPGLVMATATAPAACEGVVTVSTVPELDTTVARFPPKATVVTPPKLAPLMVTVVLPFVEPLVGLSEVIVGAAV